MMNEQAAVILLNQHYKPLYVSTEAARILLPSATSNMATAAAAMDLVVQKLIAEGSGQNEGQRYGYVQSNSNPYHWNITRCDEWTSHSTPWNYVMMIRSAELPEHKIKAIVQQFRLSPRQEQTLVYLFQGLTSKEIAQFLNLSPNTVKIHIRALMTKLQCTTRTALVGRVLSAATGG